MDREEFARLMSEKTRIKAGSEAHLFMHEMSQRALRYTAEIETAIYSEQLQKPEITKDHIVCFIERYRKINVNDLENRKRLIDTFVNSIYLYDDKIVFAFNYKDGTRELTLKELEEELSSDLDGATPPRRGTREGAFFEVELRGRRTAKRR